jgi:hypothetical protein
MWRNATVVRLLFLFLHTYVVTFRLGLMLVPDSGKNGNLETIKSRSLTEYIIEMSLFHWCVSLAYSSTLHVCCSLRGSHITRSSEI